MSTSPERSLPQERSTSLRKSSHYTHNHERLHTSRNPWPYQRLKVRYAVGTADRHGNAKAWQGLWGQLH